VGISGWLLIHGPKYFWKIGVASGTSSMRQ
jgi:hypothetical protein